MRNIIVFSVFMALSFSGIYAVDCKVSENYFSIRKYEFKVESDYGIVPEECSVNGLVGGIIFWGHDCDSSGAIENWEIESSCYDCFPPRVLIKADRNIGVSCVREGTDFGGFRFITGKDQNNNGMLDDGEIMDVTTICNGYNGYDEEKQEEYEDPSFEEIRDVVKKGDILNSYILKEEREDQKPSQPTKPKESREPIFLALVMVPEPEKNKKEKRKEK